MKGGGCRRQLATGKGGEVGGQEREREDRRARQRCQEERKLGKEGVER